MNEDEDNLFDMAARLYKDGIVRNIIIPGTEGERFGSTTPGEAWAGKTAWTQELTRFDHIKEEFDRIRRYQ